MPEQKKFTVEPRKGGSVTLGGKKTADKPTKPAKPAGEPVAEEKKDAD